MTRLAQLIRNARRDWVEIGGLGRLAVIGIVAALGLTLALGFFITATVRSDLLSARAVFVHTLANRLPPFPGPDGDLAEFDDAVRTTILGGETVRVKVWAPDGTLAYSDAPDIIGRRFALAPEIEAAFSGVQAAVISDTSDPVHALTADPRGIIEIFLPLDGNDGRRWVMEVEQNVTAFDAALTRTTRTTWLAIGTGLAMLGLFMVVLVQARARDLNARRRQAERLLSSSFRAQEEERKRIVGALHDDIGQPLYRLLYGLEGARAKLERGEAVVGELDRLSRLVRDIDGTLRSELRILHQEAADDVGLSVALHDLAETTEREAGLRVSVDSDLEEEPDEVVRTALYRAAKEAITNVRKHADATAIDVEVTGDAGRWCLTVTDDGTGFSAEPGLGLSTMRERFQALGGDVRIERVAGGTELVAWIPVSERQPA